VQFTWAVNHGIHDFASTPNPFVAVGWSYTLNPSVDESAIVINEIYYHPPSENSAEEWVELYNKGAAAVDLTDWHLHGTGFDFPNVTIPAGGYLVVAADVPDFRRQTPLA